MGIEDALNDLAETAYAAALDADLWPKWSWDLTRLIGGKSCLLCVLGGNGGGMLAATSAVVGGRYANTSSSSLSSSSSSSDISISISISRSRCILLSASVVVIVIPVPPGAYANWSEEAVSGTLYPNSAPGLEGGRAVVGLSWCSAPINKPGLCAKTGAAADDEEEEVAGGSMDVALYVDKCGLSGLEPAGGDQRPRRVFFKRNSSLSGGGVAASLSFAVVVVVAYKVVLVLGRRRGRGR